MSSSLAGTENSGGAGASPGRSEPVHSRPGDESPPRRAAKPGREATIVEALVETFVPPFPILEDEARQRVLVDVTRFVAGQILNLPTYLRFPYRIGLFAFDLGAFLFGGKTFRRAAKPAREAYLARWAQSRFDPLQDFVKLVRSCALFAYFDHPAVQAELERERRGAAIRAERRTRAF